MKGEFLIQVNVSFGANSGLELSQETFIHIVTVSFPQTKCISVVFGGLFEGCVCLKPNIDLHDIIICMLVSGECCAIFKD